MIGLITKLLGSGGLISKIPGIDAIGRLFDLGQIFGIGKKDEDAAGGMPEVIRETVVRVEPDTKPELQVLQSISNELKLIQPIDIDNISFAHVEGDEVAQLKARLGAIQVLVDTQNRRINSFEDAVDSLRSFFEHKEVKDDRRRKEEALERKDEEFGGDGFGIQKPSIEGGTIGKALGAAFLGALGGLAGIQALLDSAEKNSREVLAESISGVNLTEEQKKQRDKDTEILGAGMDPYADEDIVIDYDKTVIGRYKKFTRDLGNKIYDEWNRPMPTEDVEEMDDILDYSEGVKAKEPFSFKKFFGIFKKEVADPTGAWIKKTTTPTGTAAPMKVLEQKRLGTRGRIWGESNIWADDMSDNSVDVTQLDIKPEVHEAARQLVAEGERHPAEYAKDPAERDEQLKDWYINRKIPEMLIERKIDDTPENRRLAYDYGVEEVVKYKTNKQSAIIQQTPREIVVKPSPVKETYAKLDPNEKTEIITTIGAVLQASAPRQTIPVANPEKQPHDLGMPMATDTLDVFGSNP